jgi:hypothetical protein
MLVKEKIEMALNRQRRKYAKNLLADQFRLYSQRDHQESALPDPRLLGQLAKLQRDVYDASNTLKEAYSRFKDLSDNSLIPDDPSQDIQRLLQQTYTHLSAANLR